MRAVLTAIYAFHMPAFVFLAGVAAARRRIMPRVLILAIHLVVFQVLYAGFRMLMGGPFEWSWTTPSWILWFLAAMIVWQLTLPLLDKAPRVSFAVITVLGLGAGIFSFIDYEFSASRILVFWPFFLAGRLFGRDLLVRIDSLGRRFGAALALLCLIPVGALVAAGIAPQWLYGSRGFEFLGVGDVRGVLIRLRLDLIAAMMIAALLLVLSGKPGFAAVIGQRSLAVYLVHGFIVLAVSPLLEGILGPWHFAPVLLLCVCLSVLVTVVLGVSPIDDWLRQGAGRVVDRIWTRPIARWTKRGVTQLTSAVR